MYFLFLFVLFSMFYYFFIYYYNQQMLDYMIM